jgi:GST-like protein
MLGDGYTIVDMAVWNRARVPSSWVRRPGAGFPNVKRLVDGISVSPAAERSKPLATGYSFRAKMDEDAQASMFPQNKRVAQG